MICTCGRDGEFTSDGLVLCRLCFIDRFEGRVKRTLSEQRFKKGTRMLVVGELAGYLFTKFVPVPLDVHYTTSLTGDGSSMVVVERTMEDECVAFLQKLGGETVEGDAFVSLFRSIAEEDVVRYAELRGIRFTPAAKDEHWHRFLKSFDDHPEMKRNMVRMAGEIKH